MIADSLSGAVERLKLSGHCLTAIDGTQPGAADALSPERPFARPRGTREVSRFRMNTLAVAVKCPAICI